MWELSAKGGGFGEGICALILRAPFATEARAHGGGGASVREGRTQARFLSRSWIRSVHASRRALFKLARSRRLQYSRGIIPGVLQARLYIEPP